jgi:hypothetical protein
VRLVKFVLVVLAASSPLHAQEFVKFSDFVHNVSVADVDAVLQLKDTQATDSASVEEMRQHLLALYDGLPNHRLHPHDATASDPDVGPHINRGATFSAGNFAQPGFSSRSAALSITGRQNTRWIRQ